MQENEVPQDEALYEGQKAVCYAVDKSGGFVLAPTAGWEPANLANEQAWEAINAQVAAVAAKVRAGEESPLAFHMVKNHMDAKLLASYAGLFTFQVRRHMKPEPFRKLNVKALQRYANIFKVTVEELCRVPE